jgi:hypothetical protein
VDLINVSKRSSAAKQKGLDDREGEDPEGVGMRKRGFKVINKQYEADL